MPLFRKESLEALRQRIDLVEVVGQHVDLKPAGAAHKGLCPFHDEKSPSFSIQKGDSHFHCYGCGAHGDAIEFLMQHLKLSFHDAVESLASKFQVHLEVVEEGTEKKGPNKARLKEALQQASRFFQFYLLHTPEGHLALRYLYSRGIDLDFIRSFKIGLAPHSPGLLRQTLHAKRISDQEMIDAGLLSLTEQGRMRDFFSDRILFPIHHPSGAVIGFSGRKFQEGTFGGKYVNTPETALFKKSKVLFGLSYSRQRIAKEGQAIIVEGQIDALRLIHEGFNITVAGQGTAFTESHGEELLHLGVKRVYLALDSDLAGQEAAVKVGNFFQRKGVEVLVVPLPQGADPDSFVREKGKEAFQALLTQAKGYLPFLVGHLSKVHNPNTPAGKNLLVQTISKQIRNWELPVMVHEALKELASLLQVPEEIVGVGQMAVPNIYIKRTGSLSFEEVDPDKILEGDFLRWLLLIGERFPGLVKEAKELLKPEELHVPICQKLYTLYLEEGEKRDLLSLAIRLESAEGQQFLSDLMRKKVNPEKATEHFFETIQKLLDRNWMEKREQLKMKIQSGACSEEEVLELVRQLDILINNPPKVPCHI